MLALEKIGQKRIKIGGIGMNLEIKKEDYKRKNRLWIFGFVALVFIMSFVGFIGFHAASHLGEGALVQSNGDKIGGTFRIVSLGGSIVTEGDFRGEDFLVWFVDPRSPSEETHLVLKSLDGALENLKKEGHYIRPIIISLQSEDLDPDDLKDEIMSIAPHIMPFYATPNMVRAMTHLFHAPLERVKIQTGGHYYKAAPQFVLMDGQDHFIAQIPVEPSQANIISHLKQALQLR